MNNYDPKKVLQTTRYIYFGLVAMPTLFAIVVISMLDETSLFTISFEEPLIHALILLILMIIPASIIIPKKQAQAINPEDNLQKKLSVFQTSMIIKAALWTGIADFAIVVALLTSNYFPLIFGIIAILKIASLYPNANSIGRVIPLNKSECQELE